MALLKVYENGNLIIECEADNSFGVDTEARKDRARAMGFELVKIIAGRTAGVQSITPRYKVEVE